MSRRTSFAHRLRVTGAAVVLAALVFPPSTAAQTENPPEAGRDRRKRRDGEEKKRKPEDEVGFRWKGYPSLQLGRGTHVDLRARVQFDGRQTTAADQADAAESDFARRRVALEGEVRGLVAFEVDAELGAEHPWRDVYANYQQFDPVQVRGGQFKLPFSLDENTSPTNLDFVYRSLAARALAPGRDRGVMVHGRVPKGIVRYELGIFDRDGRNTRSRNPERVSGGRTVAGRLVVQPFRSSTSVAADLQAGLAFTSSEVPLGLRSLRGQTTFGETFFDRDLWVQGRRERRGFELRWRPGPFSLKSEYIRVTTERRGQSVEDADLSPLHATGWYVSGTWAITGEGKAAGLRKPRRPFLRGGFGAFEAAVRLERLTFGSLGSDGLPSFSVRADVVEAATSRVATIGGNWYLNQWVKVQLNAVGEAVASPRREQTRPGRATWFWVMRVQFTM